MEKEGNQKPTVSNSNWLYHSFPVILGLVFYLLSVYVFTNSGANDLVVFVGFSPLSIVSLILFIVVCFFSVNSDQVYFSFFIFVLLAFPSPVNDFFPGTFLGDARELDASVFPFITHIDIYLMLGIARAWLSNKSRSTPRSIMFVIVAISMFASLAINTFKYTFTHEILLLLQGAFQFRYLLEIFVLLSFYNVSNFRNQILFGFLISVLFLFLEASIYTFKTGNKALESGSLSNNVYASIVASILLFELLLLRKFKFSKFIRWFMYSAIVVAVFTIIGTGARMPIVAFVVSYMLYRYVDKEKKFSFVAKSVFFAAIVGAFFGLILLAPYLPKRYDPRTITNRITFHEPSLDLSKFIEIEPSWETSSLITRLKLYSASLKMINENPVAGIGAGRWNFVKDRYGFEIPVLIDSHNGYLSILSQYGMLGLPLLYFIYIYPVTLMFRYRKHPKSNFLFWLAIINFFVAFSDLSNSATFKHQIFAVLVFNSICLVHVSSELRRQGITSKTANI